MYPLASKCDGSIKVVDEDKKKITKKYEAYASVRQNVSIQVIQIQPIHFLKAEEM